MKKLIAVVILVLLASCIVTNDYKRGDLSERAKQEHAWYCGEGMMGMRAVGRFLARWLFQVPVPDVCKVIDVIVEDE